MTLEEQLKRKILERYRSVRAFTTAVGVSYSTLDSALKREHGIKNAGICTMLKIFNALNLDIESVADGQLKSKDGALALTQCSGEAAALAAAYDRADAKSRKMARLALEDFMQAKLPRNVHDWTREEMDAEYNRQMDAEAADREKGTGELSTGSLKESGADCA